MMHLVKIIHEHIEYIGEFLLELQARNLSGEQLVQNAKTYYGLELNSSDLTRRAQLLREAELIEMNRRKIYVLTEEGHKFTESLNLGNKSYTENKDAVKTAKNMKAVTLKHDDKTVNYSYLMRVILISLNQAQNDPIAKGELYPRDLYMILKNKDEIQRDVTLDDIAAVLDFLSSPLISCVRRQKNSDAYYSIDSMENVKQRLGIYIKNLESNV